MRPLLLLLGAAIAAFGSACATYSSQREGVTQLASSHAVLTADRLRNMPGVTAFEALTTMPSFFGLTTRRPAARFLLILDGMRTSTLGPLKAIQATDVREIRVVDDSQSLVGSGEVEVIVNTFGGPTVRP